MTKIEALEQEIYNEGIELFEHDIDDKAAIAKNSFITAIVYNKKKIKDDCDYLVALSHEYGHYSTATYYHPYMLKSYKWKMDYEANLNSVRRLVPIKKLKQLMREGVNRFEISLEFCVPEDFVDEAVHIYQRKGLLPWR